MGTAGAVAEVGRRCPIPTTSSQSPCLSALCLSLPGFPARSRFQLWCFPGKPGLAFCWLSSCRGLDGPQGEGRTWNRENITFGGSCSLQRLQVPRTSLVPWLKLVALNQLSLLPLKGREGLLQTPALFSEDKFKPRGRKNEVHKSGRPENEA